MRMRLITKFTWLLALVTGISACGSGSSGGSFTPPPPPGGGIERCGIAIGPIDGFGSVILNDRTYDTVATMFTIDGQPGTQSQLKVGQYVSLHGTVSDDGISGTADILVFNDNVEGPIQSIDLPSNSMVVLGQDVFVTSATSFDDTITPASLEGLAVNDIVEVSGFVDANGNISATRIDPKPAGGELEVRGVVSSLDNANSTFMINALLVDYSGATLANFPGSVISDGDPVEAKGMTLGGSGELIATTVEFDGPQVVADDGDSGEIEGLITRFVDATDFDVGGFPITTDGNTVFEGGTAGDLGLNLKVEVEGDIDSQGVLLADEIEIRLGNNVRIEATADNVDAGAGTVVLLGISVQTDIGTRFEDKSSASVNDFGIDDISVGDYLAVRGSEIPAGSGIVTATLLERDDPETEVSLRGFIESVTDPDFTVLGVTTQTDITTEFEDDQGTMITAAQFFGQVAVGTLVESEGTPLAGSVIDAEEVEIENEE